MYTFWPNLYNLVNFVVLPCLLNRWRCWLQIDNWSECHLTIFCINFDLVVKEELDREKTCHYFETALIYFWKSQRTKVFTFRNEPTCIIDTLLNWKHCWFFVLKNSKTSTFTARFLVYKVPNIGLSRSQNYVVGCTWIVLCKKICKSVNSQ